MQAGDAAQIHQYQEYCRWRGHDLSLLPQCMDCSPDSIPRATYIMYSCEFLSLGHDSEYREPLDYEDQDRSVYLSDTVVTSVSTEQVHASVPSKMLGEKPVRRWWQWCYRLRQRTGVRDE